MIKDSELLKLIMERYPEQPFDFILEQFTIFKAGLIEANGKLAERDKAEDIVESAKIETTQDAVSETICLQLSPRRNTRDEIWWRSRKKRLEKSS